MPKRTIILAALITITIALLLVVAFQDQSYSLPIPTAQRVPPQKLEKTAVLSFNPKVLTITSSSTPSALSVDIMVDTGGAKITGVQIELQYDPLLLKNVSIGPSTGLFQEGEYSVFMSFIDESLGRISYAIGANSDIEPKDGTGAVATILFTPMPSFVTPKTQISFLEKTMVTAEEVQESMLKDTQPLEIQLPATFQ